MSKHSTRIKTVETLEPSDCRWPIGDPRHADFHFCGEEQETGHPYCQLHWKMSSNPASAKSYQKSPRPTESLIGKVAPIFAIRRAA
jgi:GcrA cell cycle regulator